MSAAAIQPFKQLDEATEAALRASIARFGVVVPIVVDGMGRIIDGHHRARIAKELNLTCPQVARKVKNDDDATALAYSLNADRRHMSFEQRREIAADLRAQGFSLRAIAGATGVSESMVRKDLDSEQVRTRCAPAEQEGSKVGDYQFAPATVDAETGEVTDDATGEVKGRIKGMDGKSYPRKREVKDPTRTREGIAAKVAKAKRMAADGFTSRQIGDALGIAAMADFKQRHGVEVPADDIGGARGVRAIDQNRVIAETVATIEGAAFGLSVVSLDYSTLDRESLAGWVSSLSESLRSLTTLKNNLKKELTQ